MNIFKPASEVNWLLEINKLGLAKSLPKSYLWKRLPNNRWKVVAWRFGKHTNIFEGYWEACDGVQADNPNSYYECAHFLTLTPEDIFIFNL